LPLEYGIEQEVVLLFRQSLSGNSLSLFPTIAPMAAPSVPPTAAPNTPKNRAPERAKKIIGKRMSIELGLEFPLDAEPFIWAGVGGIN
jgi:hypothetical protein